MNARCTIHPIFLAAATAFFLARPATAVPAFEPYFDTYPTGVGAPTLATGDLDGDGLADVVLAASSGGYVFVLIGRPGGAFAPPVAVAAGPTPRGLALADLNGDGRLDLLTANNGSSSVSVLLGNGDGTFTPGTPVPQAAAPWDLALSDLDLDTRLDLLVFSKAARSVTIRKGLGDGTFGPVVTTVITVMDPQDFSIGEATRDAYPDLAVASAGTAQYYLFDGGIHLYHGRGDGTFGPGYPMDNPGVVGGVRISDVDGDGRNDIWSARSYNSVRTSIYYGNADSTFSPPAQVSTDCLKRFARGDVDGDGIPDLVGTAAGVSVFHGLGNRTYGARTDYGAGCTVNDLTLTDLDGDDHPELLVATGTGLSVLRNTGSGFRDVLHAASGSYGSVGLAVGDVNEDGRADLTVVSGPDRVALLLGNGDGTFANGPEVSGLSSPLGIRLADMNGDGHQDLLVTTGGDSSVRILPGDGTGAFAAGIARRVGGLCYYLDIGDLDGDGVPDIVVGDQPDVTVLLGKGDGTIRAQVELPAGSWYYAVTVRDLNGDGHPDIAATEVQNPGAMLFVWINQGDGRHYQRTSTNLNASPSFMVQTSDIAAGDLDGDGAPDLVVITASYYGDRCAGQSSFAILRNLGNGSFEPARVLDLPPSDWSLALADVDHDGRLDITAMNNAGLAVRAGNGTLTPEPSRVFGTAFASGRHILADLDGDGWLDAAVVTSGNLAILRNRGALVGVPGPGPVPTTAILRVRPNPAHEGATLTFTLPSRGRVSLRILDVQGRVVRTIVNGPLAAGTHAFRWDRSGERGRVAPGVYLAELSMPGGRGRGRIVVLD